jgi:hypothetical protein
LRVRLKGFTKLSHRTKIYLNGTAVDEQTWQGQVAFDHAVTVDPALLRNGDNVVKIEALDTGANVDQLYINWIELDYRDMYVAEDDQLVFQAPQAGSYTFRVTGFGDDDLLVFDITDPAAPQQIAGSEVTAAGGTFTLRLGATATAASRLAALTTAQLRRPAKLVVDTPSNWASPQRAADYILITHEDFYSATLPLADFHRSAGLRVAVVKVEDVYDEFNFGIFNPIAIRRFLRYAYQNWQPAPTFVLLVGDGTLDYQDRIGTGVVSYVPSQVIEAPSWGQTASDNWFVTVAGDDVLPDLLIGRFSVETPQQAEVVVDKTLAYAQQPPSADWNTQALLVADDGSLIFEGIQDHLADRLPFYYQPTQVYAAAYPPGSPVDAIRRRLDSGSVLVSYVGHGDTLRWGKWNQEKQFIWSARDVADLAKTERLAVMTLANCLNGFFAGLKGEVSLAESFQRAEGKGAVAVFAPTSLGASAGHAALLNGFYDAVFGDDQRQMGRAATQAKLAAYAWSKSNAELVETYVLLGDPALDLGIPTNYPYVAETVPALDAQEVPVDQPIRIVFNKPVDPASVTLAGGDPGWTQVWSDGNTVVTFSHPGLSRGKSYELGVTGKDKLGNPLGKGPVPSQWRFTVSAQTTSSTYIPALRR